MYTACKKRKGGMYMKKKTVLTALGVTAGVGAGIAAAEPAIDAAADEIRRGGTLPARRAGLLDRLLSGMVNPVFYAAIVRDRGFCATGACTGCGRCAALCPLENIRLRDGRPVWNGNCTHCMACICACPAGAIEYGKASEGKPRYYLDDGLNGRK